MSAIASPMPAMIGRITNGGFNITSRPLGVAASRVGVAVSALGLALGDGLVSGDGDGESDGDGCGVGVTATPCRVKLAHGFGRTLAHRW
jgi:hypothetical protein